MDEGSGNTVVDSSGNGHTLVLADSLQTPLWVADQPPTTVSGTHSLQFDGADDFASTPATSDLDLATGFTIEAWIKADQLQLSPDQGIISKWDGNGYMIWLSGNGRVANVINGDISSTNDLDLRDNTWHHVATVWDGANRFIYIDGVLSASDSFSTAPNHTDALLLVGKYFTVSGPRNFHGNIDEVKIFNIARAGNEIRDDAGITVQVFLNEFMPHPSDNQDWVEIVNVGSAVDISGWKLTDIAGVFHTFPSNTILNSGSFLSTAQFQRLDNGGDTIFLQDSTNNTIDTKSYTGEEVILDKSIGRLPDGTGSWQPCNLPSQNATNIGSC